MTDKLKLFVDLSPEKQFLNILNGGYEVLQAVDSIQILLKKNVVAKSEVKKVEDVLSPHIWKDLMISFTAYLFKEEQRKQNRQKYSLVNVLEMIASNPNTYYAKDDEGEIELFSDVNPDNPTLTTIYSKTELELKGTTFALKKLLDLFPRKKYWSLVCFTIEPIDEAVRNEKLKTLSLIGNTAKDTHKDHSIKDIFNRLP